MPTPLLTPRVNNNDDTVRLVRVMVKPGDHVRAGELVAEVETDKATYTVESEQDGFVLAIAQELEQTIDVGSVLLWLGATPDETPPAAEAMVAMKTAGTLAAEPTLKAAQLLARHGLSAGQVPVTGERLTVHDVEMFLASRHASAPLALRGPGSTSRAASSPEDLAPAAALPAPGTTRALTPEERGMVRTVTWQREEAVPGYVELQYDVTPWETAATEYQASQRLLLNPLLSLMAYRLVRIVAEAERLNATIVGDQLHVYRTINLGFTVQSGRMLYLAVVQDAGSLTCPQFVARLGDLQRGAMANKLRAAELTQATVAFTSMARWNVTRHVPVLPPYTSLIVAHSAAANGTGTLGATYDHRVLTGFDALAAIRDLTRPEGLS